MIKKLGTNGAFIDGVAMFLIVMVVTIPIFVAFLFIISHYCRGA